MNWIEKGFRGCSGATMSSQFILFEFLLIFHWAIKFSFFIQLLDRQMNRWPAMLKWPMRAHNVVEMTLRHTLTTGGLGRGRNAALNVVRFIDLIQPFASIPLAIGVFDTTLERVLLLQWAEEQSTPAVAVVVAVGAGGCGIVVAVVVDVAVNVVMVVAVLLLWAAVDLQLVLVTQAKPISQRDDGIAQWHPRQSFTGAWLDGGIMPGSWTGGIHFNE